MKNRFLASFAILALIFAGVLCIGARAQTTDEGKGPTEQPSSPMEIGQQQGAQNPQAGPPQPGAPPPGAPQAGPPQGGPGQGGPGQAGPMGDAEPGGPSGEEAASNDHGVARISMIHGAVSTQRGDSGDWSAAILNQPVVGGDKVSTGEGGRTELQLDFANILRLGSNSKANIANLTKDKIQIQVGQGIANFSVFKESETEPEIDTPNVAVHPAHNDGVFRIEVRPDGDTLVIVRKGEAQISTPKGIAEVHQGEMATVRGTVDDAQYKISAAPDADNWDRWNSDRDHMIRNAQAWKHTNHYYTGSEDLDANGTWQSSPDYGEVWVPNEPEGWVPYRDGNWVYEPYYGWTWVGYEPWGWAPYHYGRWLAYGGGWAWWPGPVWGGGFYRPFWAPAYVSFYGWGWGFGFGFGWGGWGGFGWLPIGPGDWFHPWWGGYGGRFGLIGRGGFGRGEFGRYGGFAPLRASGFSTVGHINDARVGGAMSAVSAGRFGVGRVTASAATHEQLSGARMMAGNLPVVPSRTSLSASGRAAAPSTIRGGTQSFYGTQSTARTESFQRQTAQLRQSMRQNHVSSVQAGRGMSGSGFGGAGTTARAGAGVGSGGRENSEANRSMGAEASRSSEASGETQHSAGAAEGGDRGGFRPFTPPSHSESAEAAGRSGGESGSYWGRTSANSAGSQSRGYTDAYGRGSSRPQLNMRQPVVQPRSSGGYRAPSYGGGSHSAPSSSGGGHASGGGGGGHSGGGGHR